MEVINGSPSDEKKQVITSGVLSEGMRWEIRPRWMFTKGVLAEYLAIVAEAAEAAINKQARDPIEEAARALAAGFGAAMVSHGRELHEHGYDLGDLECKASLGLLGEDGEETAQYHRMREAAREAERLTGE